MKHAHTHTHTHHGTNKRANQQSKPNLGEPHLQKSASAKSRHNGREKRQTKKTINQPTNQPSKQPTDQAVDRHTTSKQKNLRQYFSKSECDNLPFHSPAPAPFPRLLCVCPSLHTLLCQWFAIIMFDKFSSRSLPLLTIISSFSCARVCH